MGRERAMPVRLQPFPPGAEVPRRRLRVVGEDGSPRAGSLVLVRYPGMEILLQPPLPARTDAAGVAEVVAPPISALDVYEGGALLGTFVVARGDATLQSEPREIRVPTAVRVRVALRGLEDPAALAWLRGPDVESLEADERTGWARIDGEVRPGWMAFPRAHGALVRASEGPPPTVDVVVPRGRPVSLVVAGREAVLRADGPKTIELDWATLPPFSDEASQFFAWSLTREGLDAQAGGLPSSSPAGSPR
jgi:hypothetical protein